MQGGWYFRVDNGFTMSKANTFVQRNVKFGSGDSGLGCMRLPDSGHSILSVCIDTVLPEFYMNTLI